MNVKSKAQAIASWHKDMKWLTEMNRDGYIQNKCIGEGISIYIAEKCLAPFYWDFATTLIRHHYGDKLMQLEMRWCEIRGHKFEEILEGEHSTLYCKRCGYASENIWWPN